MKLYLKKDGRVLYLNIFVEGSKLISEFGVLGGVIQRSEKPCTVMNAGRSNERSPEQQALFELNSKITRKKKEGFSEECLETTADITVTASGMLSMPEEFPSGFCPNKPTSQAPQAIRDSEDTFGQRKYNGHCIFLVVTPKGTKKVFSRRMEDLTPVLVEIPVIKSKLDELKPGSFILSELVFFNAKGKEVPTNVSYVTRAKTKEKALASYEAVIAAGGGYSVIPFDMLWLNNVYAGNMPYLLRKVIAKSNGIEFPEIYYDWKLRLAKAKDDDWEGFVLRQDNETSYIGFTLDGKAHRAGSWKEKFHLSDEFFVTKVLKGKSGKHAAFYAKFKVAQYDTAGNIIDRSYVNCGKLTHSELAQLTLDIDAGTIKLPFVVEIEFAYLTEAGAITHGVIQRIRYDKTPEECIYEE